MSIGEIIELEIPDELFIKIALAAHQSDMKLNDFIVNAAVKRANEIISQTENKDE